MPKELVLNYIDFAHIFFLNVNDSSIKIHEHMQGNKLNKLLKKRQPRQDSEKFIFKYFNIFLSLYFFIILPNISRFKIDGI